MGHWREMRTLASEVKFVVKAELAVEIRAWARKHLDPDPHGGGRFGDEYRTATVYFDTEAHDVYHRRGSFGRSKYRIRKYGDSDVVFLERKLREPNILAKRRTRTDLSALTQLAETPSDHDWPGQWFHRRLIVRRLHPVCQVTYARTARVALNSPESLRLTLDDELEAVPTRVAQFPPESGVRYLRGSQILELKFRRQMPGLFKRLVEEFALAPQAASKYRLGMGALGQIPQDDTEASQRMVTRADDIGQTYV
jgi:hypothetical protein